MTPKQILLAHLAEFRHAPDMLDRRPSKSTYEELSRWHARQHHRLAPRRHYHEGVNLGADQRPPGWRTGEDAVRRETP